MHDIVQKVIDGDVRTVARLVRDIDDGTPGTREILKELYPHTGNAYIIGITGSPGVGKSTLVNQMIKHLRNDKKTVGVIAVDPTSPFSGGAILGDRTRMQNHATDPDVFIRSMATRGQFGGLTRSTRAAIDVLDAMGKNYILVETVGVGQDEVDVEKSAHTTVIVAMPGMGDDIQAIKAGILEVGDIFAINKSDREGVEKLETHLRSTIEMAERRYRSGAWKPPIVKTQAAFDKGIDDLLVETEKHRCFLIEKTGGLNIRNSRKRVQEELTEMVKNGLIDRLSRKLSESGSFEKAVKDIVNGKTDPYTASAALVETVLNSSH